jgi:hypothetical protein
LVGCKNLETINLGERDTPMTIKGLSDIENKLTISCGKFDPNNLEWASAFKDAPEGTIIRTKRKGATETEDYVKTGSGWVKQQTAKQQPTATGAAKTITGSAPTAELAPPATGASASAGSAAGPITIATFKAPEKSIKIKKRPYVAYACVQQKREDLGISRYNNNEAVNTANALLFHGTPQGFFSLTPYGQNRNTDKQLTDQQVSSYLAMLDWIGNADRLKVLQLFGQKEITSIVLTSFPNIEEIQLHHCEKLKHIILGNAENLQKVGGLADIPFNAVIFCAGFNLGNQRLIRAFSEAKPGTIICTKLVESENAIGNKSANEELPGGGENEKAIGNKSANKELPGWGKNVNKTLTPLFGYKRTHKNSWKKVTWNQKTNQWESAEKAILQASKASEEQAVSADLQNEIQASAEAVGAPGAGTENVPEPKLPSTAELALVAPQGEPLARDGTIATNLGDPPVTATD